MKKTNGLAGLLPITRRQSLLGFLPVAAAIALGGRGRAEAPDALTTALQAIEQSEGGRLGVTVLDTASGTASGYRSNELFAMCSTFKLVLSAAILQRVDAGIESLDRPIAIVAEDIMPPAPITEAHVGGTMTVGELCHATVTTSDNPAANLLLKACGGPEAVTMFLRSLGDGVTRLDRYEPHMNNQDVAGGDIRDTTSPAAMAETMRTLLLGDILSESSRAVATSWLKATITGPNRLRGGLPPSWDFGHKTGTGEDGPTNDIGIAWPPNRSPIVVTAYYERKGRTMKENETVLAEVGRIVGRLG